MDDFVIKKISRGMLIVSLNGHEISFEGEIFFPNNEFHFSLYAKTAKFTKTNQILSKEELDNILEHLKKEFILKLQYEIKPKIAITSWTLPAK